MPIAVYFSHLYVNEKPGPYMALMLVLETAMLGVFMALDLLLFFVFFEFSLIPMYFLIGKWGGSNRVYAALKFFLYTFAGSALMLVAILVVYFYAGTLNIVELQNANLSSNRTNMDIHRLCPGICRQGAYLPFPYMAAGCTCAGANRRFHHSCRRPTQNGDLWLPTNRRTHFP